MFVKTTNISKLDDTPEHPHLTHDAASPQRVVLLSIYVTKRKVQIFKSKTTSVTLKYIFFSHAWITILKGMQDVHDLNGNSAG